jgi:hypothetical protein
MNILKGEKVKKDREIFDVSVPNNTIHIKTSDFIINPGLNKRKAIYKNEMLIDTKPFIVENGFIKNDIDVEEVN